MYCKRCGRVIQDDAQYCQFCGCEVDRDAPVEHKSGAEVVWKVFARISRITGIVSLPLSIFTFGLVGIEGLVLGIIALKAKDENVLIEAKRGITLNAIAMAIGIIALVLYIWYMVESL